MTHAIATARISAIVGMAMVGACFGDPPPVDSGHATDSSGSGSVGASSEAGTSVAASDGGSTTVAPDVGDGSSPTRCVDQVAGNDACGACSCAVFDGACSATMFADPCQRCIDDPECAAALTCTLTEAGGPCCGGLTVAQKNDLHACAACALAACADSCVVADTPRDCGLV